MKKNKHTFPVLLSLVLSLTVLGSKADIIDWAIGKLGQVALKLLEVGVTEGVKAINDYDHDPVTGALLYILPHHRYRALYAQGEETQRMVQELQGQVDVFENDMTQQIDAIGKLEARNAMNAALSDIKTDAAMLKTLDGYYAPLLIMATNCYTAQLVYTNGEWVTNQVARELTTLEQDQIKDFSDQLNSSYSGLEQTLYDLEEASDSAGTGDTIYSIYQTSLAYGMPFRHQMYPNMYTLYNYLSALAVKAMFYEKEYHTQLFLQQSDTTNATAWLQAALGPKMTIIENRMISDITNNVVLAEMARLLPEIYTNAVTTNIQSRLDYLADTINVNYAFPSGTQAVYKVTCNKDQRNYLITKVPQKISVNVTTIQGDPLPTTLCDVYYPDEWTADGRYQAANMASDLSQILALDTAGTPYNFLADKDWGGLRDIQTPDGILLYRIDPENWDYDLHLLDANNFSVAAGDIDSHYIKNGTRLFRASDVYHGVSYTFSTPRTVPMNQALFMMIYRDMIVAPEARGLTGGYYYSPATLTSVPTTLALIDQDTLDLSNLRGNFPNEIHLCGEATIVGGGLSRSLTNCLIKTYGGHLTISNLFLTAADTSPQGYVLSGSYAPCSIEVQGANTLTGYWPPLYLNGQDITITGAGSLTLYNTEGATTGWTTPAIATQNGNITIQNASSVVLWSQNNTTTLDAGTGTISIVNSVVTSHAPTESDIEFKGSHIGLTNSTLNMSWGVFADTANCIWTGNVRGQANLAVHTADKLAAGTSCNIYVQLNGSGTTTTEQNIETIAPGQFKRNDVASFRMPFSSPGHTLDEIQSIHIRCDAAGANSDWVCESVAVTLTTPGTTDPSYHTTVPSYHIPVNFKFNPSAGASEGTFYPLAEDPSGDTTTITSYQGNAEEVLIPSTIGGRRVVGIDPNAFSGCWNLKGIVIPEGVTSLGTTIFTGCTNLNWISIPATVTNLVDNTFNYGSSNGSPNPHYYFHGDAPSLGDNVFNVNDNNLIVYPPNAKGWGPSFGGCATVAWDAQLAIGQGAGSGTNAFWLAFTGADSLDVMVEATSNLQSRTWSPQGVVRLVNGEGQFEETGWTESPMRFYRLSMP